MNMAKMKHMSKGREMLHQFFALRDERLRVLPVTGQSWLSALLERERKMNEGG